MTVTSQQHTKQFYKHRLTLNVSWCFLCFRERSNMENQTQTQETTTANSFTKQIGKTTYLVNVHFSETSTETLQDKMERLIKNECINLENQK